MAAECMVGTIRNISRMMDHRLKEMIRDKSLPLLLNHIPLFYLLPEDGTPIPFFELQSRWGTSKSSISEIISRYEPLGYVSRQDSTADKRSNLISLCPEGLRLKRTLEVMEDELLEEFLDGFSPEEQMLLQMLLHRVEKNRS